MIRTLMLALALVGAVAALAAPASARIDPRPDAHDGAASTTVARQDLRSPDTRDTALSRTVVVVPLSGDRHPVEADGFDWTDAALGSGVTAGLLLLAGAGGLTLMRGYRGLRQAARI
jgi:hypothetical protein